MACPPLPNGRWPFSRTQATNTTCVIDHSAVAAGAVQKGRTRDRRVCPHPKFGFDKIEIRPLTTEAGQTSLSHARMRALFVDWAHGYEAEARDFDSVFVWAECVCQQLASAVERLPTPNALSVAVCCMVLERLTSAFGPRCAPLVEVLRTEIFNALYVDYHCKNNVNANFADPFNMWSVLSSKPQSHSAAVLSKMRRKIKVPKFSGDDSDASEDSSPAEEIDAAETDPANETTVRDASFIDLTLYMDVHDKARNMYHRQVIAGTKHRDSLNLQRRAAKGNISLLQLMAKRACLLAWRQAPLPEWTEWDRRVDVLSRRSRRIQLSLLFIRWRTWHALARRLSLPYRKERNIENLQLESQLRLEQLANEGLSNQHAIDELTAALKKLEIEDQRRQQYLDFLEWQEKADGLQMSLEEYRREVDLVTEMTRANSAAAEQSSELFQKLRVAASEFLAGVCHAEMKGRRLAPAAFLQSFQQAKERMPFILRCTSGQVYPVLHAASNPGTG
eukprot:TRINITY_DN12880_c0_g1_i2.p1 TRINITY_DN12880_c0_g1~~TRINITY_DN12880_c0_g1_i2.p1  ORF type:complete len:518 (+),score=78.78 TRINITY_DN12880_c0_g1_i2:44-1555(+)